ncbi:MAG: DNA-3-methyladenine glycosylase [Janthinobacterium lividum]
MTADFTRKLNTLPLYFFQRPDVLIIARELLGKHVFTCLDGEITGGRIVETEAYRHEGDPSLTLHVQRKARQAQALYQPGGHAYLYTVYRVHTLFNITAHDAQHPDTVLIRAIEPLVGTDVMLRRRGLAAVARNLTAGPGVLSQALGLTPALSGEPVSGPLIWFEDAGEVFAEEQLMASSRVGLEYAGAEAVALPWRFRLKDSKWTSPAK